MGNEERERVRASKIFAFCEFFSILKIFHFSRILKNCLEWQCRRGAGRIRRGYYIPFGGYYIPLGGYYIHLEVSGSAFVFECEFVFRLFIRKFEFVIVRGVMKFSRERAEA